MDESSARGDRRRIFSRVDREEFVGRARELSQITAHPERGDVLGLLLLLEPSAGVSGSCARLMTAYSAARKIVPIYFALSHESYGGQRGDQFLNAFLSQYLAFRRNEPELVHASLTLSSARAGA
jgi:hypothetical protein